MPLKNTLQKAANGCFSNKIETDSPENVMFPGGCDYEVIEIMKIFGTDYTFEHNTEMCTKLNIDGMCQQYNRKITVRNMNDMLEDDADADAKKKCVTTKFVDMKPFTDILVKQGLNDITMMKPL